ncbi:MAG: M42 family peptidase [Oscillospiraceae bacterium]|nr:M42 family peptidase [Oscillospiraceae bacterium]
MNYKELVIELCSMKAPSGFEAAAGERVKEIFKTVLGEAWIDAMGNVIGVRRCGKENAKKLLLDAHLDEIGLLVTAIEDGFVKVSPIGGVDSRILPGSEVTFLTQPEIHGIVCTMPPHVLSEEDQKNTVKIQDTYIDTGLSQEQAEKLIPLGTAAILEGGGQTVLGEDRICSKALDDRACLAAIICAADALKDEKLDFDLYLMASTQEELGMRGAKTGVFSVDPDWCLAVDVTHAHTPDSKPGKTMKGGEGPAIGVGPNMTKKFSDLMIKLAKEAEMPHQIEVMGGNTGTNAWVMQVSRGGVATALVSIPIKYMHTPFETMQLSDGEKTVELIVKFVKALKGEQ